MSIAVDSGSRSFRKELPRRDFLGRSLAAAAALGVEVSASGRLAKAVAQRKNVVVKVSGIIASATPGRWNVDDLAPIVNHTLDVFGPDRVMFGGDWPVCNLGASYKEWFDALSQIVSNRPESEQRRLFHDNAIRHYRLA